MAETSVFPYIAEKNWWALREQFQKSRSTTVSPIFVKTLLNVSESSAKKTIRSMQILALVDDEGKLTDLANKWRLDATYAEACSQMVESTYPEEMRNLFDKPEADRNRIMDWIMSFNQSGSSSAFQGASMYLLLLRGDIPASADFTKGQKQKSPSKSKMKDKQTPSKSNQEAKESPAPTGPIQHTLPGVPVSPPTSPIALHIDLQIHISPEATGEQIDQIFSSIARHLRISEH